MPRPTTQDSALPISWVGLPSDTPTNGAEDTDTPHPTVAPSYSVLHACLVLGGDVPSCVAQAELYGHLLHEHTQNSLQKPLPEDSTPSGIEVIQHLHPYAEILEKLPGFSFVTTSSQQQEAPGKDQYIESNFPHASVVQSEENDAVVEADIVNIPPHAQVVDDIIQPHESHLPMIQQLLSQVQAIKESFAIEQAFQNVNLNGNAATVVKNPTKQNENLQAQTVPSVEHQLPQTTARVNELGELVPVFQNDVEDTEESPPQTHSSITFVLENTSQGDNTTSLLAALDDTVTPENYQVTVQEVQEEPSKTQLIQENSPPADVAQSEPLNSQPLLSDPLLTQTTEDEQPVTDVLPNFPGHTDVDLGVQSQLEAVTNDASSIKKIQNSHTNAEAEQTLSDGADEVKDTDPHLEAFQGTPESTMVTLSLYPDQGLLQKLLLLHSQSRPQVEQGVRDKPSGSKGTQDSTDEDSKVAAEATDSDPNQEKEILIKPLLADLIGSDPSNDREVPPDATSVEVLLSDTLEENPGELLRNDSRAQLLKKTYPHAHIVSNKPTRFFRDP